MRFVNNFSFCRALRRPAVPPAFVRSLGNCHVGVTARTAPTARLSARETTPTVLLNTDSTLATVRACGVCVWVWVFVRVWAARAVPRKNAGKMLPWVH